MNKTESNFHISIPNDSQTPREIKAFTSQNTPTAMTTRKDFLNPISATTNSMISHKRIHSVKLSPLLKKK